MNILETIITSSGISSVGAGTILSFDNLSDTKHIAGMSLISTGLTPIFTMGENEIDHKREMIQNAKAYIDAMNDEELSDFLSKLDNQIDKTNIVYEREKKL